MPKPTAPQCHAMVTYYIGRYTAANNHAPTVNRNTAKSLFESILWDHSIDYTKALVDFFVDHYDKELEWFRWNYEKVIEEKEAAAVLLEHQAARRAETARRLEEWNKRRESWQTK